MSHVAGQALYVWAHFSKNKKSTSMYYKVIANGEMVTGSSVSQGVVSSSEETQESQG